MPLKIVRIDLGEGDWAEVFDKVLRVTGCLIEEEYHKHMTPVDKTGKVLLSEIEAAEQYPKTDYEVDLASINNDLLNEIYIFNQVGAWSFGPVDLQTLNTKLSRAQYKKLCEEMDRLYKPAPLASGAPDAKP